MSTKVRLSSLFIVLLAAFVVSFSQQKNDFVIESPDGVIKVEVSANAKFQ